MKYIHIILFTLSISAIISCGKDEVNGLTAKEYVEQENLTATKLDEGVYISFITEGTGQKPHVDSKVRVSYSGYLTDKKSFDSNDDATFLIRNLIRGWQIGMKEMPVGSKAILVIPPAVGYGGQDRPRIPANSTLVFDIEILEIVG